MLKHDWTILLFYQSCSIMLTVLLQGCWANNPVIASDIFTRVPAEFGTAPKFERFGLHGRRIWNRIPIVFRGSDCLNGGIVQISVYGSEFMVAKSIQNTITYLAYYIWPIIQSSCLLYNHRFQQYEMQGYTLQLLLSRSIFRICVIWAEVIWFYEHNPILRS